MVEKRHRIRRLDVPYGQTFDEQIWPIDSALVVLGAFALTLVALLDLQFNDPRLLHNATTWIVAIPLLIVGSMVAMRQISTRRLRRVVMLSLVLSLVLNVWLMIILGLTTAFFGRILEKQQEIVEPTPETELTIPEYVIRPLEQRDNPRRQFERPVETGIPTVQNQEVARQVSSPNERRAEPTERPAESQAPTERPSPRVARRQIESAPRRSHLTSQLARQLERATPPRPNMEQLATQQQPPVHANPARVQSESLPVTRQHPSAASDPTLNRLIRPDAPVEATRHQLARRENDTNPLPRDTSQATFPRRMETARRTPESLAVSTREPSVPRETSEQAVQLSRLASNSRQLASPDVRRPRTEPIFEESIQVRTRPIESRNPLEPSPQIASTPPSPRRQVRQLDTLPQPTELTAESSASTSSVSQRQAPQIPTDSELARRSQVTTLDITGPAVPSETLALSPDSRLARRDLRRTQSTQAPSMESSPRATQFPQRTQRQSRFDTSPSPISSPSLVQSNQTNSNPTAAPARVAVSKSVTGTTGVGMASNLDRGEPAEPSPTILASDSARRDMSTQQMQDGPAVSPSLPARTSRARAQRNQPTSPHIARPVPVASTAGMRETSPLQADASAAMESRIADATAGQVTASKGRTEIDLGPPRVAASIGRALAAGGGQPQLNLRSQAQTLTRKRSDTSPTTSIAADRLASTAASRPGETGGERSGQAAVSPSATSLTQAIAGGESAVARAPAPDGSIGEPSLLSSSDLASEPRVGRSQMAEAEPSTPRMGGGTRSATRASANPPITTSQRAELVSTTGSTPSAGRPIVEPVATEGVRPRRTDIGVVEPSPTSMADAMPDTEAERGIRGDPGTGIARRRDASVDDGPTVANQDNQGGRVRRRMSNPRPSFLVDDTPMITSVPSVSSPSDNDSSNQLDGGLDTSPMSRPAPGSLLVDVDADSGPGGLDMELNVDVGVLTRRAQEESEEVEPTQVRFVRRNIGGPLAFDSSVELAADAFRRRLERRGDPDSGGRGGVSPKTEEAIELGLVFLAQHQNADGSWSLNGFGQGRRGYDQESASMNSDAAATAMAILSFLGAGYHHRDFQYKDVVNNGLEFLVAQQHANGNLYGLSGEDAIPVVSLYSHGLATIALCEAYGMTQDPSLRDAAQRAIKFISETQHPQQGGWRYTPGRDADTSVTGWMMMAIKSGELASLEVPQRTYRGIEKWLESAQASESESHLYSYNPFAPDVATQRHGRRPSKSMTAVGLLMRLYLGWRRDDPRMVAGADHLLESLPEIGTASEIKRDTYYWYYATQVLFHMGGDHWEKWNRRLHPLLIDSQVQDGNMAGSWDPRRPIPDRWGPHGGRIYVTALNLLALEVYYRHLPIYEETAR